MTTPGHGPERTAVAQSLVDALRPWLLVLNDATTRQFRQDRAELEESRDGRSCTAWLTLEAGDDMDVRVFEALELVTLLRAIDAYAYMVSVGMVCGYRAIRWLREHPSASFHLGCRINFGFRAQDAVAPIAEQCARLVVGGVEYDASSEFVMLRSHLETWRRIADPLQSVLEIPVEVAVYQGSFEERVLVLHQLVLLQMKRKIEGYASQYQHWTPLFEIQKVDPGAFMDYISTTALLQLTQIAECGVKLDKICLHGFTVTPASALIVAAGLQLLTRAPRVLDSSKRLQYRGVEELDIPAGLSCEASRAIFSALLDSTSVRTVGLNEVLPEWRHDPDREVTMTAADRLTMWQWAAIALFSELKTNSVELVRMRVGNLTADDVEAMRNVLQSTCPLDGLLGIDGTTSNAPEVRSVVCSRFLLFTPSASSESDDEVVIECSPQHARVLSDDGVSDYISVLLPGWGQAWALRANCDDSKHILVTSGEVKSIPRATLCYINDSNKSVVTELLGLIGERMRDLRIVGVDCPGTMDAWVRSVFVACPQLDSFELHDGRMQSLLTVAHCYEEGLTQASQLDFYVELEDTHGACDFFRKLADTEHPMTRCLRNLRIWINRVRTPFTDLVSALEAVSAKNTKLVDLHFDVKFQHPQHMIPMESVSHIREYSQNPVSVRDGPLAIPQKIAFLSVLQQSDGLAPCRLDNRAITNIFEFAATCKKRTIHIFSMEERNEEAGGDEAVDGDDQDGDESGEDNQHVEDDDSSDEGEE